MNYDETPTACPPGNLTIIAERIRKAADTCHDAARILRILFPEAFSPQKTIWDEMKPGTRWVRTLHPKNVNIYIGRGKAAHEVSGIGVDYCENHVYSMQDGRAVWTDGDATNGIRILD